MALAILLLVAVAVHVEAGVIATAGVGFSPTQYGGDTSGALVPSAHISTEFGNGWAAGVGGKTALYTDQVSVGRARFTMVGPEVSRFVGRGKLRPFLRASADAVVAQWAPPTGKQYVLLGGTVSGGVRVRFRRWLVCDAFGAYTISEGTVNRKIFDAPPREMEGLRAFAIGVEVGFHLGSRKP